MAELSVSVLTAYDKDMAAPLRLFEEGGVDYVHMDVMDGHFVPALSFDADFIEGVAGKTRIPFDIHLMVQEPETRLSEFIVPNTEFIVIHAEAVSDPASCLAAIRALGVKNGVALNPSTPVAEIEGLLAGVDQVLVMSVNPGYARQKFMTDSTAKIRELSRLREQGGHAFKISVDGGINAAHLPGLLAAGADMVVSGSAILDAPDPEASLREIKALLGGRDAITR